MNPQICKKCLNVHTLKYVVGNFYNVNDNIHEYYIMISGFPRINKCQMKITSCNKNQGEVLEMIKNNQMEKFIKIDNSCPYYAEHQLYDWNKEK